MFNGRILELKPSHDAFDIYLSAIDGERDQRRQRKTEREREREREAEAEAETEAETDKGRQRNWSEKKTQ